MSKTTYNKEFLQQQTQPESVNIYLSAFEVINDCVKSFSQLHQISNYQSSYSFSSNDVQQYSQQIYLNLQTVFEWMEEKLHFVKESGQKICESPFNWEKNNNGDDQLYSILNQYKDNNKKLKQSNKSLQQKLMKVQKQNENLLGQVKKYTILLAQKGQELSALRQQNFSIETKNNENNKELEILKEESGQLMEQLSNVKFIIEEFEAKMKKKETENIELLQQNKILKTQLSRTKETIEKKVKQNVGLIEEKVKEKLKSKQNWNLANYQSMKKVLLHIKDKKQL